jgi:type VI secretion system protein ImpE
MMGTLIMSNSEPTRTSLPEQIQIAEESIRREPVTASHRWALFQWLCVDQQWKRALQQLQAYAQLAPDKKGVVQAYRDLVRAERWREKTLTGKTPPGHVMETEPQWMSDVFTALEMTAAGQIEAADAMRERALDQAPLVSGRSTSGIAFEWIGDSDSRLGPICEVMAAGAYRWLSFADIARWQVLPPSAPCDLVWAACEWTLMDGVQLRGFMPARYPDYGGATHDQRDNLLMGRETTWRQEGQTGIIASGRKTWTTSAGEFDLFEMGECVLNHAPPNDNTDLQERTE